MVVNQDHYINRVLHEPGDYELDVDEFDTPYVLVAVRILVDPHDPDDLAAVNALQDSFGLTAGSAQPFVMPDYDKPASTRPVRRCSAWPRESRASPHAFGTKDEVDPVCICSAPPPGGAACPSRKRST